MSCRFSGSSLGGLCTGTCSHYLLNVLSIKANKVSDEGQIKGDFVKMFDLIISLRFDIKA